MSTAHTTRRAPKIGVRSLTAPASASATASPNRLCRVNDRHAPNGIAPEIIVEIWPNGVLVFREKGRQRRYQTTAGKVFSGLVWREAMVAAQAKKDRKKKARKNAR